MYIAAACKYQVSYILERVSTYVAHAQISHSRRKDRSGCDFRIENCLRDVRAFQDFSTWQDLKHVSRFKHFSETSREIYTSVSRWRGLRHVLDVTVST